MRVRMCVQRERARERIMESKAVKIEEFQSMAAWCVHVHHCCNSLRTECCISGELSAPWKAPSDESMQSRFHLNQKESQKQRTAEQRWEQQPFFPSA